jgi:carbon monoxide dehydrogenase subunit G
MKLSNQIPLPVDQARAWEALNDLETLKVSIPGWLASTILTARRQLSWPVEAGNEFNALLA